GVRSLRSVIDLTAGASSRRERRHLQAVGRPAPLSMDVIAGICAPASQTAAAWSMYVLLGSGALSAFCRSAAQHFLIDLPLEPPVFVGVAVADAVGSGGGASGKSSIGAVSVVALAAGGAGRGGGGSSFWHPRGSASAARSGQNRRRDGARLGTAPVLGSECWAFEIGFMEFSEGSSFSTGIRAALVPQFSRRTRGAARQRLARAPGRRSRQLQPMELPQFRHL